MGNILKDIHDMVKDGGDNNGQDKRKKPNKETATYANVLNEPTVVVNKQSRLEDPADADATVTEYEGDVIPSRNELLVNQKEFRIGPPIDLYIERNIVQLVEKDLIARAGSRNVIYVINCSTIFAFKQMFKMRTDLNVQSVSQTQKPRLTKKT